MKLISFPFALDFVTLDRTIDSIHIIFKDKVTIYKLFDDKYD